MKKLFLIPFLLMLVGQAGAQKKERYILLSAGTVQNALPLGKFAGLFGEILHPGFELGYGRVLKSRQHHDWLLEYRAGYFYHRFVQHALPLTVNLAYRYKINPRWSANLSLGAGYLHSLPATDKWRLNENGEYENDKGLGRMQGTATLSLGAQWVVNPSAARPVRLTVDYQQRLQFPFVKSYVPLLPYNGFQLGFSRAIKRISK